MDDGVVRTTTRQNIDERFAVSDSVDDDKVEQDWNCRGVQRSIHEIIVVDGDIRVDANDDRHQQSMLLWLLDYRVASDWVIQDREIVHPDFSPPLSLREDRLV